MERGRGHVSAGQPRLGQIQARQLARLALHQHVLIRFLVEFNVAGAMHLLVHIHAVDHFADGVGQAGRVFFKLNQLLIKILRENESLGHVVVHRGQAYGIDLLLVDLPLMLVARQVGAVDAGGNLVHGNAGVHGPRLDGLDQALDGQRHGVVAIAELDRSFANLLQNRLGAVDGVGARIEQRLDHVMQVGVAHIAHANLAVDGRNHHDVIGAVDAGIDGARREHGLDDHDKPAPLIG